MIKLNNGSYTCKCVYVINNQIGYTYTGGTYYYTQNNNRRISTTGHQVTGIWKKKALWEEVIAREKKILIYLYK